MIFSDEINVITVARWGLVYRPMKIYVVLGIQHVFTDTRPCFRRHPLAVGLLVSPGRKTMTEAPQDILVPCSIVGSVSSINCIAPLVDFPRDECAASYNCSFEQQSTVSVRHDNH